MAVTTLAEGGDHCSPHHGRSWVADRGRQQSEAEMTTCPQWERASERGGDELKRKMGCTENCICRGGFNKAKKGGEVARDKGEWWLETGACSMLWFRCRNETERETKQRG
jgi:hypothetical protein